MFNTNRINKQNLRYKNNKNKFHSVILISTVPSGFTLTLPPPHRLTVAIICLRESTDGFDEEEVDVESTSEVGGFVIVHVERAIENHPS